MSFCTLTIETALAAIATAHTPAALWVAVSGNFEAAGFDALAYLTLETQKGRTLSLLCEIGFDKSAERKEALARAAGDPLLIAAFALGRPVVLRRDEREGSGAFMCGDESDPRANTGDRPDGFGLPLFGPNGSNAMAIVWRHPARESGPDIGPTGLHMIAQAAHLRLLTLGLGRHFDKDVFSTRDIEIMRHIAEGRSNADIARSLDISVATVDNNLRQIFRKLDVADRTAAAVKSVGLGLVRA